ncbi:hypothetical protein O8B39_01825 [Agrobacterium rhizogenes]|uniref:hypothetical protein n=1 Tax=Agrobacterium leguminum TaxID=2792015 RepID=UPI0022BC18FD|nr:hypothetical protein [Rhizobium rhizogenes]
MIVADSSAWISLIRKDAPTLSAKFRALMSPQLAIKAAANYRFLRERGYTIRKSNDLIIGTYCIEHGHKLLQNDRDFQPMADHLGLRLA